jgi:hypothetical protein
MTPSLLKKKSPGRDGDAATGRLSLLTLPRDVDRVRN